MSKLQIHDLLRAKDVERWTIINKVRRQSIAEHSYTVAIVALALYDAMIEDVAYRAYLNKSNETSRRFAIFAAGMFHDSPETRYGDVPTPGKGMIKAVAGQGVFDDLDEALMPEIPFVGGTLLPPEQRFIEMADLIESAAWIRENGIGEHARIIAGKTHMRLVTLVDTVTRESGVDWYGPVNSILMALGAPIIHHNSWIHGL